MALQIPKLKAKKELNIYLTKNSYLPPIMCASRPVYNKVPTHVKLMGDIIWASKAGKMSRPSLYLEISEHCSSYYQYYALPTPTFLNIFPAMASFKPFFLSVDPCPTSWPLSPLCRCLWL